jgi:hypothetical protein
MRGWRSRLGPARAECSVQRRRARRRRLLLLRGLAAALRSPLPARASLSITSMFLSVSSWILSPMLPADAGESAAWGPDQGLTPSFAF